MRNRSVTLALSVVCLLTLSLVRAGAGQRQLTVDDIYDPAKKVNFDGDVPRLSWLPDGTALVRANMDPKNGDVGLRRVDPVTGREEPLLDAAKFERAVGSLAGISPAQAKDIAHGVSYTFNDTGTALVFDHGDDLYFYDIAAGRAMRLTSTPGEETNAGFSPDGRLVAYARDGNLFVADTATGRERALTTDGGPNRLNGHLDWVYEEELYGRGETTGYWWSPDSTRIAYLSLDESRVPEFVLTDDKTIPQTVEHTRYPQAGDPNPGVQLGVVPASGGSTQWVDLSSYEPADTLVVRVGWSPNGADVVYQVQNRVQNRLDLNAAHADTGAPRRILHEESQYWVDAIDVPTWLPDGSFLWQSDRTGFRHVYHYAADGKLIGAVTHGDWDVRTLYGVSRDGWVYVSAAEHSPIADHVYRVKTDGTGFARLTDIEGNHTAVFNSACTMFLDYSSTAATPAQLRLRDGAGAVTRVIDENKVATLAEFSLGTPEFLKVPTRDGFVMDAMMIKPPNFDPSKKYPVFAYTYAGPGAAVVRDRWGSSQYMWHQLLASRGYIIWMCDNRSASGQGVKSAYSSFHQLGVQELADLEDGIAWLAKQPYVDATRVGMWGWSYGGFMTSYALTHSDKFKIGIVGAPVTDWRRYDSIYTERYMGLPGQNADGYDRSSVTRAADKLSGRMLLIHGAIDNNVHVQNSIQFMDALQKSNKQFQFMLYPQSRHGVTNPLRVRQMREMMTRFILDNL